MNDVSEEEIIEVARLEYMRRAELAHKYFKVGDQFWYLDVKFVVIYLPTLEPREFQYSPYSKPGITLPYMLAEFYAAGNWLTKEFPHELFRAITNLYCEPLIDGELP